MYYWAVVATICSTAGGGSTTALAGRGAGGWLVAGGAVAGAEVRRRPPLVDFFDFEGGVDLVVAVGEVGDPGAGDADFVARLRGQHQPLVLGDDLDVESAVVVRAVDVVDEALVFLA